ncbi:MAG: serine/threonine protein phosphatase [Solibacterales bacterium]|nr:serine/threonine protein phosphatase [Bryobacterales bacterium]|tara:strand:- start:63717 stop:64502 length:786 start_codon:yes stop_codon:yes gene_type:complete
MIFIKGGEFLMGTDTGYSYEGPSHRVVVDSFYLDATEVTNQQFSEFVEATGYITESEKQGSSGVFDPKTGEWDLVTGANWRHPEGPNSDLKGRDLHPVIHISWNDAVAFSAWARKRLPTEAEWEYAASGMGNKPHYPWGDELMPKNQHAANWWQGVFPTYDLEEDGFSTVAPVKQFPATGDGLYDMGGNVWEWVADWYDPTYYRSAPTRNPIGPEKGNEKVHRGGSWMCSRNYCRGFRVAARQKTSPDTGLNNLGFRCAAN